MRQDLYKDLYEKEQDYWWHVGKRAIVYGLLDSYLPSVPGDAGRRMALDLGCGAGLNLDHLAKYAEPVGTDFSEEALLFCKERGHSKLCKADAAELPFPGEMFDIITALDVVEHLDDDSAALIELRRVLKPGGLLIISVPAYALLWSYCGATGTTSWGIVSDIRPGQCGRSPGTPGSAFASLRTAIC